MNHPIVCLCGSMRFYQHMLAVADSETRAGAIVLMPHAADQQDTDLTVALDELHRAKIRMATTVVVVSDSTGYYGASTTAEIAYAGQQGIPVKFWTVDMVSTEGTPRDEPLTRTPAPRLAIYDALVEELHRQRDRLSQLLRNMAWRTIRYRRLTPKHRNPQSES